MSLRALTLAATALACATSSTSAAAAPEPHVRTTHLSHVAPLLSSATATRIPNQYIVMLKPEAHPDRVQAHLNWLSSFVAVASPDSAVGVNRVKHVYNIGRLKGYAGVFDERALDEIRAHKDLVDYVEHDQVVAISNPVPANAPVPTPQVITQKDAPWGLSRISHRKKPQGPEYKLYSYMSNAGAGVTVYIVDTGINIKHVDFEGRAIWGATIPENDGDVDGNGHGTHCAGTVAGKRYGVAKKANVVAVKVLASNGSGTMSDVVKGVEWAAKDHKRRAAKDPRAKSAANMSLGGGASRSLDRVVNAAVDAGVHFAVAAGNDNKDACNYSPAAADKAVTVGATAIDDARAYFSNVGTCVDVFAPGKDILSTWIGSNVATNTISGTSMASPHVAGLLAYLASQSPDPVSPKVLKDQLLNMSTKGYITGLPKPRKGKKPKMPDWPFPFPFPGQPDDGGAVGKTPNKLIFTGVGEQDDAPEDPEPQPEPQPEPEPEPKPPGDGDDDGDDDGGGEGDEDEENMVRSMASLVDAISTVAKAARSMTVRARANLF